MTTCKQNDNSSESCTSSHLLRVDVPNLVTSFNWTRIFEWYVLCRARHWAPTPTPMPISAHAHGFWVGMGAILFSWVGMGAIILGMDGHGWACVPYYNGCPHKTHGRLWAWRGCPMSGSGSHSMLSRVRHNLSVCLLPDWFWIGKI